jgi:hypothetical protein
MAGEAVEFVRSEIAAILQRLKTEDHETELGKDEAETS